MTLALLAACAPYNDGRLKPRVATQSLPMSTDGTIEIKPGDTVYSISQRHKVPISAIVRENNLPRPYILQAGSRLRLPAMASYTVQPGDTYETVAAAHAVTPQELAQVNSSVQSVELAPLKPGDTLSVPAVPVNNNAVASITAPPGTVGPAPTIKQGIDTETHSMQLTPLGPSTTPPPGQEPTPVVTTPSQPGIFDWPLEGRMLRTYGRGADGSTSDGINIAAPRGTPVTAAAGGTVIHAGSGVGQLGNLVLVRHEGGYVTAYGHLERVLVDKDSIVAAGDVLGTVGDSGGVKVPQLHFQVRKGETPVNPQEYLPSR